MNYRFFRVTKSYRDEDGKVIIVSALLREGAAPEITGGNDLTTQELTDAAKAPSIGHVAILLEKHGYQITWPPAALIPSVYQQASPSIRHYRFFRTKK